MQFDDLPQGDISHQARRRYNSLFFRSTRSAADLKSSPGVASRSAIAARARSSGARPRRSASWRNCSAWAGERSIVSFMASLYRVAAPSNTYQAPACQEQKPVRSREQVDRPRVRRRPRPVRRAVCADLISERGVRRWGLHQTLIEARSGDHSIRSPERRGQLSLRGLETHSCPPAGRFNTTGSGLWPVPVSAQLGGGAAHSARATGWRRAADRAGTASNQHAGLRDVHRPTCSHAVGAAREHAASTVGLSPKGGSS